MILYVHTLTQTLCSATPHPGVVDLAPLQTRCVSWYIYSDFIRTYINTDIMFGYSTPRSRGSGTRSTLGVYRGIFIVILYVHTLTQTLCSATPHPGVVDLALGVYRGIFIVILYVHTLTQTLCSATPHPGVVDLALGVYRGIFIVILYVHTLTQTLCSATPHPGVVDLAPAPHSVCIVVYL